MSQHAELKQWIVEQTERGCTPESLVKAMLASGYQEPFAEDMLLRTLKEAAGPRADAILAQAAAVAAAGSGSPAKAQAQVRALAVQIADPAAAGRLPEPELLGSPTSLRLSDREVQVLFSMEGPQVVLFGGLLSDQECDELVAGAHARLARSQTVDRASGASQVHQARTSEGMFFERGETELIRRIESRIAELLNWPVEHGEGLQVLHYGVGGEYKPHYDYFDLTDPGTAPHLARGGNRLATLIMYLNTPDSGGGTLFPDLNLEVAPRRGNAIFFSYDRPHPSTKSLHGGAPVVAGEKWIATKWLRSGVFK
jgi:prolyl 4-hydroxylase